MAGIGARGGGAGLQGGKPKEEICKLPWMKSAKMCQNTRRRRSVSANPMSVGFGKLPFHHERTSAMKKYNFYFLGPLVVPEDQEIANERPTAQQLVDAVGEDSTIFASEQADVDEVVEIERIEIVEVVEPGHNDFLKKRRSIIIASMAVGCFILFALSVLISSRVSCICSKPDRVSDCFLSH